MPDSYSQSFEKFLSHTDEKKVLLSKIEKIVSHLRAQSILDIGAGNGLISIPLAKKVGEYLALEQNNKFYKILSQAGLSVIPETFPTPALPPKHLFDLVLSSHSISYEPELLEPFV